ncbi:hypothetical protein DL95DRAFT_507359 [Leptodontidium sp. 2 PMI_412]|nr:hypothetical protein BKA61DRAFT_563539 [Leptodontidium sp. MPI-SDFR-AT-0119]KAH9213100.1 hypothetical protein DL95DRAFT_507359 [Leptodontidium sp. 2 PMI_412]
MLNSLKGLSELVATTFFVLATITIVLRIYSRAWVVMSFGWDDWCMVSILFFNAGHQAILHYFIQNGGGLHVMKVMREHPEWMQNLVHALFAEEIMYSWMHFIIKTAFLLFYLRFAINTFRKLAYATMGINLVFTLATILLYCFQCRPLDAFFNPLNHPDVKCIDNSVLAFVPAAFSIFVDVLIVILPIQSLWAIQASLRKRLMLISIISLGGIVVIISCIRLIILREFQKKNTDFTYVLGKLIIISSIELEVAIMVANAPSLKILYSMMFSSSSKQRFNGTIRKRYAITPSNANFTGVSRSWFDNETGYAIDCSYYVPMSPTPSKEGQDVRNLSTNSKEQLWKRDSVIIVTSSVGVETTVVAVPQEPTPVKKPWQNEF